MGGLICRVFFGCLFKPLFFEGGCLDQDSQTVSLDTNLNFKTQPKMHGQSGAIDLNHFQD